MFGRRSQTEPAAVNGAPASSRESPASAPKSASDDQQQAGGKSHLAAKAVEAGGAGNRRVAAAKAVFNRIQSALLERIDASAAAKLPRDEL